ncbi:N-acyl homoserine lactonase family protein [Mesorhizobium sp. M3A.F.Ca.ET.201.01.1.1]|uniref:N-acyl homoserine lactonase family protein n=1 Tax=Mesorhizobium sp. M3A.F.Ca.ET.201.01.1.1 TaxID=2563946 RepID=UPI001093CC21|nr:N-acyl homoserine lactonase family protein [Mesorhizobium sp. M3A.F.Ca.ET.201.01.1.1]TGS65578.1 N-acyl homoserine lactonase family protein [Mesorhizobium sp. M3A.F.Ca.ET.201.01.1.1]
MTLQMTAVNAGPLTCPKNTLAAFATGEITIPSTVAIFQHPQHGVVLWDTGINDAVADPERAEAYWGAGNKEKFGADHFKRDDAIDRKLDKLGIQPKDVRYVVYSHLHLDHAGGMSYFPNAVHVVQRDEVRNALFPADWTSSVYCGPDLRDIRKLNVLEIDGDFDLFADGTFRLVKSPGHTPGMQMLFVTLPNRGRFILGGDVGHLRDKYNEMIPMPWDWNAAEVNLSRKRVQHWERLGIPLFLCHDPGDFAKLPTDGTHWD